jgi:hypothetical protein
MLWRRLSMQVVLVTLLVVEVSLMRTGMMGWREPRA